MAAPVFAAVAVQACLYAQAVVDEVVYNMAGDKVEEAGLAHEGGILLI